MLGERLSQVYRQLGPRPPLKESRSDCWSQGVCGIKHDWDGTVPRGYCPNTATSEETGQGLRKLAQESGHRSGVALGKGV